MPPVIVAVAVGAALSATAIGATVLFGTITLAHVGATIAAYAVSGSMARRAARKADTARRNAYNASLQDRTVVLRSAVQPRNIVLGRDRTSGPLACWFTHGSIGQYHAFAVVLAGHECDAVEQVFFNDEAVTLDASGFVTAPAHFTKAGAPLFRVRAYLGSSSQQAAPELVAAAAAAGVPASWDSTRRGVGVTYLSVEMTADFDTLGQIGVPNVSAVVRGVRAFDPRSGTVGWTQNPALLARWFLVDSIYSPATLANEVNNTELVASAQVCDESIALSASTNGPRYTCNGSLSTDATPIDNLGDILDTMDGDAVWLQGQWQLMAGYWREPTLELDASALSAASITVAPYVPKRELFNQVVGTYTGPASLYQPTSFPMVAPPDYQEQDNGEPLPLDLAMPLVNDPVRCQMLAWQTLTRARQQLRVELGTNLKGYATAPLQNITLHLPELGYIHKPFTVLRRELRGAQLVYHLQETNPDVWDWHYTQAQASVDTPNTALPDWRTVPALVGLAATSGTADLLLAADGTVLSRVRLSWGAVANAYVAGGGRVQIQTRTTGTADWVAQPSALGDDQVAYLTGVVDGQALDIRARAVNALGQAGPWTEISHTVLGKTEPPPPFDVFVVLVQPDGTRQFNFAYTTTPRPADLAGAEIRYLRGSHAAPDWLAMTPLNNAGAPYTASPVEANTVLSGLYTFACRARDTSGNLSTVLLREISLPERRLGNIAAEFDEGHAAGWPGTLTGGYVALGPLGGLLPGQAAEEYSHLEATDSTAWDGLPATWDAWARWNTTPATLVYTSPVRDLGVSLAGALSVELDATGTATLERRTSADNTTWSAWADAAEVFQARYVQLRLSLAPGVGAQGVPALGGLVWRVGADTRSESFNDIDITTLGASYLGVGDVRVPLDGTYSVISFVQATVQSSVAGAWTWHLVDKLPTGPRLQFRLDGVLANPYLVDFFIEGY